MATHQNDVCELVSPPLAHPLAWRRRHVTQRHPGLFARGVDGCAKLPHQVLRGGVERFARQRHRRHLGAWRQQRAHVHLRITRVMFSRANE